MTAMTRLGKVFVFTILVLGFLCCAYAVVVFADPVNFGWDPKKVKDEEPSEIAKRDAVLKDLAEAKGREAPYWELARAELAREQTREVANQLRYQELADQLRSPKPMDVRELKTDDKGQVVVGPDGFPEFGAVVARNTALGYLNELNGLQKKIDDAKDYVRKRIEAEQEITEQLNGREDPATKKREKGLYDLIGLQQDIRRRAEEELADLKPHYFQELVDSQLYLSRRESLRRRVKELENLGPPRAGSENSR